MEWYVQYEEECAAELTRANIEEQRRRTHRLRLLLRPGAWLMIRDAGTDEPADVQTDDAYFAALSESLTRTPVAGTEAMKDLQIPPGQLRRCQIPGQQSFLLS